MVMHSKMSHKDDQSDGEHKPQIETEEGEVVTALGQVDDAKRDSIDEKKSKNSSIVGNKGSTTSKDKSSAEDVDSKQKHRNRIVETYGLKMK